MIEAVYYEGLYLLLPPQFADRDAFVDNLRTQSLPARCEMVVLREDHKARNFTVIKGQSMAPYFLSGYHDEPSVVSIADPDAVYPVQVEVLDQKEYNDRLREAANRICPGCLRFKPLSNRVQSLNGHFEELALDGTCLFRQETKPSPRIFHDHLFSFGGFYRQFHYEKLDADEMRKEIAQWFYLRYAAGMLTEAEGEKTLTLTCKKKELLTPIVTDAVRRYLEGITGGAYHIRLPQRVDCSAGAVEALFAPEQEELFRKECKKYGVAFLTLEFDPDAADRVRRAVRPLCDHYHMFLLDEGVGKDYYLVADTSYILKELRYRTPLLQTHNTHAKICDQLGSRRYRISFQMEVTQL